MSGAFTAVAVGTIVSGAIAADSARSSANKQADALRDAQRMSLSAAEKARLDVLDIMDPAMTDYARRLQTVEQGLADGTVDIMNVLQESTGRANELLESTGISAEQAIMGSAAGVQGIPRQQFDQQYSQLVQERPQQQLSLSQYQSMLQNLPEDQRTNAELEMSRAVGQEGARAVLEKYGVTMPSRFEAAPGTQAAEGLAQTAGGLVQPAVQPERQIIMPDGTVVDRGEVTGARADVQMVRQPDGSYAPATTTPQIGYAGATQAIQQATGAGLQDITQAERLSLQDIAMGKAESLAGYQPYAEAGTGAVEREAALSGALGPEAQQQAIDAYIESPGQQYLREQQEQALLRNQAAIGGLGGGRVRTALQEQAFGIAATQQQQHLENLRSLATRGQEVAGAQAGISTTAAQNLAAIRAGAAQQRVDLSQLSATQLAQLAQETGLSIAQLRQAIGTQGAQNIQTLGGQLSSLQGATLADIAALRERGATTQLQSETNLAQFLANLGVEAGSTAAQYEAQRGSALAAGRYAQGQAWGETAQGLGNIAGYGIASAG